MQRALGDVELLVRENECVLRLARSVLFRLLGLKPGVGSSVSLLDSVPIVQLKFSPLTSRRLQSDPGRLTHLSAFAALARHSHRLSACPELKRAFWVDMLNTTRAFRPARGVHTISFMSPQFPRFVIHFAHYQRYSEVDSALAETLYAFMTTPAAAQTQQQEDEASELASAPSSLDSKIAFDLSFARCNLTAASLGYIERVLDRVFAHPDRQYDVRMLDFSENSMNAEELAVIARIVRKKAAYQIEELRLDEVVPDASTCDWERPDETPSEFIDIMRAVFDVSNHLPRLSSYPSDQTASAQPLPSKLSRVSFRENYLCPKFFAAYFSALRYACPVLEDVSWYIAKEDACEEEKREYWRWMAFGLFYPRPKRFASAFELRNIGRLECSHKAATTFGETMRNPAAELVYHGALSRVSGCAVRELMVCSLTKNAVVEIFDSHSQLTRMETLHEEGELEAVCEREDGSFCVVVPGVGLGWVQPRFVVSVEREPLDASRSQQDGWFDVEIGVDGYSQSTEGVAAMIESVGPQMRSLAFHRCNLTREIVLSILANCSNLQRLSLGASQIGSTDCDTLVSALRESFGRRLLSLNLNGSFKASDASTRILAASLVNTDNPPALRELRLHGAGFRAQDLECLDSALRLNQTLVLIELTGRVEQFAHLDPDDVAFERTRLDTSHQGLLLRSPLPMTSKLAFLSVMACSQSGEASARSQLDSWLVLSVFGFAASRDVRRRVFWNANFERDNR